GRATAASARVHPPASSASRPSRRARASGGSTTTRSVCPTSTSARYTPYAAKKPSVLTPCPNFRARIAPAIAAAPVTTAVDRAVRRPLERALLPDRAVRSMAMRDDTTTWTQPELNGLRAELGKFDTAGTSEEYGNVRESVAHHHDFDDAGGLILHERSPINPKSIYATAKVAADFLTMNYHDAYGIPGVVTRMFNNYGPRQNPRYVTGTIITQALTRPEVELGALEPLRDFCFTSDGVRGHLMVAAHGVAGDLYVYGQGTNISMADWTDL